MDNIKRIIIPVDNTEDSKKAVEKGAKLAKLLGIDLKIITINDTHHFISSVIIEEKLKKDAEKFLNVFKEIAQKEGVNLTTELITGKPAEEIVKYVSKDDLIIMAHHDRTQGIDKFMETSVSRDVVRNSPCSVLVLK